jgi:phage FluMu protein Com
VALLKFIATNDSSPKCKKINQVDAVTYQETTAHTSTMYEENHPERPHECEATR